jgi:hypothetical protein
MHFVDLTVLSSCNSASRQCCATSPRNAFHELDESKHLTRDDVDRIFDTYDTVSYQSSLPLHSRIITFISMLLYHTK